MSSTIDFLNASADWRFVVQDIRAIDGTPLDLTGYAISVTFRPDCDIATAIQTCGSADGSVTIAPGSPAATPATGPSITIVAAAAGRSWRPSRPMLVVGDIMISRIVGGVASEDEVKRLAFVALPGT